ncbi:hypothetical protein GALL_539180 [mine drainage metagenome]|uniref:Uncharacterized protein n=1 Tax=mine drainage metagenome TaxID=410659 RepID=A0A1J5PGZ6_9ZZZZ
MVFNVANDVGIALLKLVQPIRRDDAVRVVLAFLVELANQLLELVAALVELRGPHVVAGRADDDRIDQHGHRQEDLHHVEHVGLKRQLHASVLHQRNEDQPEGQKRGREKREAGLVLQANRRVVAAIRRRVHAHLQFVGGIFHGPLPRPLGQQPGQETVGLPVLVGKLGGHIGKPHWLNADITQCGANPRGRLTRHSCRVTSTTASHPASSDAFEANARQMNLAGSMGWETRKFQDSKNPISERAGVRIAWGRRAGRKPRRAHRPMNLWFDSDPFSSADWSVFRCPTCLFANSDAPASRSV